MARWKLLNAHHLNIEGNTWEYKETDRSTGRQIRREFLVPQHLSPFDPGDWNYKTGQDEGDVIVANKASDNYPRDYIFKGDPTPDMLPLDDEAKAISATFSGKWKYQAENMNTSYSQSLIDDFHKEMESIQAKTANEPSADVKALTEAVTKMAEMQATMLAALAAKPLTPTPERRV